MAVEKIQMFTMAVTDMAKAKEFYADKLGFQVTRDYGQGDRTGNGDFQPVEDPSHSERDDHAGVKGRPV
jgi:catechol 2,3-dioxygenase-like lactoylglutathione lyase family enzyme